MLKIKTTFFSIKTTVDFSILSCCFNSGGRIITVIHPFSGICFWDK